MTEENISKEFTLKNIDVKRNYFIEHINQNGVISEKHKKVSGVLNFIEHLLILVSTVTGCVCISAFASLVDVLVGITSSAVGLEISVITAGIKKYKLIIKKKKKKNDQIVLLTKSKLNKIEVLICEALTNSNIIHDEFATINSAFKEYDDIKEEIKNLKT